MTAVTAEPKTPKAPKAAKPPKSERPKGPGLRRTALPYLLLAPGVIWLIAFFVVPMFTVVTSSVETGNIDQGYVLSWRWANFSDAFHNYGPQIAHSLEYSVACTVFCLLLAYPLAYYIAFKAGRWKNLLMALVVAPFFTSYLIRTVAWETILGDQSPITHFLNAIGITPALHTVGLTNNSHSLINTTTSLVCGMVYNFLPFTVLPLYTALEKIDPRLLEAGADLYGSPWATFRKVTFKLALPGFVGGTLLTFIPAVGDYTNAVILGGPNNTVIGTKIEYLMIGDGGDVPGGSALSVVLMVGTLLAVLAYIKKAGTEELV